MSNFNKIYSRLRDYCEQQDKQIREDPVPFLNKAYDEMNKLRELLEKIDYALSPDYVYDCSIELNLSQPDINTEAYTRCSKAQDLLDEYRSSK